jgi:uncharacterized protein YejL (UPF0352 family)
MGWKENGVTSWRSLSTKPKYAHLFQATIFLINFLHETRMDLTYEVVGDIITNLVEHGWAKDF